MHVIFVAVDKVTKYATSGPVPHLYCSPSGQVVLQSNLLLASTSLCDFICERQDFHRGFMIGVISTVWYSTTDELLTSSPNRWPNRVFESVSRTLSSLHYSFLSKSSGINGCHQWSLGTNFVSVCSRSYPFWGFVCPCSRYLGITYPCDFVVPDLAGWLKQRPLLTSLIQQQLSQAQAYMKHQVDKGRSKGSLRSMVSSISSFHMFRLRLPRDQIRNWPFDPMVHSRFWNVWAQWCIN